MMLTFENSRGEGGNMMQGGRGIPGPPSVWNHGWYHGDSPLLPIGTAGTGRSPCSFVWLYQPIYVGKYDQDCGRTATAMDAKSGECSSWVVPPFQLFPPYIYMYSFPHRHPSQGISQYGDIHQSDQGCSSRQKSSSPGNPGSASSCPHRQEEVCWHHLVDPLEENLLVSISKPLKWEKEKPGCWKWRQYTSDNEGDYQVEGALVGGTLRVVNNGFQTSHKARNEEKKC